MSAGREQSYSRYVILPKKDILNAESLASQVTTSWFSARGFDQLAVNFDCTHGGGATTALTGYFETSSDQGTTAYQLQTSSIAVGVETINDHSFSKAFTTDVAFSYVIALAAYDWLRLVLDAQEAADVVSADIILGKN